MSYDDLQYSWTKEKKQYKVVCPDCREERSVDEMRECPVCGKKIPVGIEELKDGKSREAGESLILQSLLSQSLSFGQPQFLSPDLNFLQMARAQQGLDIESLIQRMLSDGGADQPTASSFIKDLDPENLKPNDFFQLSLMVSGLNKLFYPTEAAFGMSCIQQRVKNEKLTKTHEHIHAKIVKSNPFPGGPSEIKNIKSFENNVILMLRGDISFADKAKRAEAAKSLGVVVVQNQDVWPYIMTDQLKQAQDVKIPCVMVSKVDGDAIIKHIDKVLSEKKDEEIKIIFATSELKPTCPICQDEFDIKEQAIRLPCQHFFHPPCILPWLKKRSTCPLCRYQLPTEKPLPKKPTDENHTLNLMIS